MNTPEAAPNQSDLQTSTPWSVHQHVEKLRCSCALSWPNRPGTGRPHDCTGKALNGRQVLRKCIRPSVESLLAMISCARALTAAPQSFSCPTVTSSCLVRGVRARHSVRVLAGGWDCGYRSAQKNSMPADCCALRSPAVTALSCQAQDFAPIPVIRRAEGRRHTLSGVHSFRVSRRSS